MTHPNERDLVLYLTGDADQMSQIEQHIQQCGRCREEAELLRRLLEATRDLQIPEPDTGFEERIWARQRRRLQASEAQTSDSIAPLQAERVEAEVVRPAFWSMSRVVMAGSVAAMLVVAFLVGLYTPPPGTQVVTEGTRPGTDRVLLVAVGDHLERTRMVLIELVNAESADGLIDLRAQQARARALLGDNRLYRQTASLKGETEVADLLDEVERVLLEMARSPAALGAKDLEWLRRRIESRDLLFRVRVIEGRARWDEDSYLRPMDAL